MSRSCVTCALDTHNSHLLGHRGARGEYFENTQAGFQHTQRLQQSFPNHLVGIEFDVQLTLDGHLVVFHDESLLRLYGRQSRIDQLSTAEIKRLNKKNSAASQPAIVTLDEMPKWLSTYQHIELEIKTHSRTNYQALIKALRRCLAHPDFDSLPITLTSFDLRLHYYLQIDSFLSHLPRGLLVEPLSWSISELPSVFSPSGTLTESSSADRLNTLPLSTHQMLYDTPSLAARLGCSSLGLYYPLFNASVIQRCQYYGLSTTAWTVNQPKQAINLIELGVNYVITDYPTLFLQQ